MKYARRSLFRFSLVGACLYAFFNTLAVGATGVLDTVPALDNIVRMLELTREQEARLRPLFERRLTELQQAQSEYQRATTPQQQQDVLREAKKAAEAFNSQVEAVLTPSQKYEWREFRAEARDKVKERAEDERESR